jgi:hypothetical protein
MEERSGCLIRRWMSKKALNALFYAKAGSIALGFVSSLYMFQYGTTYIAMRIN